jgi:hypothetical protein
MLPASYGLLVYFTLIWSVVGALVALGLSALLYIFHFSPPPGRRDAGLGVLATIAGISAKTYLGTPRFSPWFDSLRPYLLPLFENLYVMPLSFVVMAVLLRKLLGR